MKKLNHPILFRTIYLFFFAVLSTVYFSNSQNIRSFYFLDGTHMAYEINPAATPKSGFIYLPGLMHTVSLETKGLGPQNLFYQHNGNTVSFLDSSVSTERFLNKLSAKNTLNFELRTDIVSIGWYKGSNLWTVGIYVNAQVNGAFPKEFFSALKNSENEDIESFRIRNLNLNSISYASYYVGFSRELIKNLHIGGRFKVLSGISQFDINYDKIDMVREDDYFNVQSDGTLNATLRGLSFTTDRDGMVDGFKFGGFGFSGFGGAIDLGARYQLLPELNISASVLDLGFIGWKKKNTIKATNNSNFEFDGFGPFEDEEDAADQLSMLGDDLLELFNLEDRGNAKTSSRLNTKVNVGVEYNTPFRPLTVGLLSSSTFYKYATYTELTLSANFSPVKWFDGALTYSFIHGKFRTFGLAAQFSTPVINFAIGSDYMFFNSTSGVPNVKESVNAYFGITVPLQRKKVVQSKPLF